MKREVLEYAALPDVPVGQLDAGQRVICGIAWIADNEGYGVKEAAKKLIDFVRTLAIDEKEQQ